MKKLFVILAVVGLIIIGSMLYYESKLLEEPIIIANEVDLGMNTIHISYITNGLQPHELQSVEIDGMHYYPQNDFDVESDSQQSVQWASYVNYTYYSIFAPSIPIQIDDGQSLTAATEGTVHFTDGHTEKILLNVRQPDELTQLYQTMSFGGTDGSEAHYEVVEPFTLHGLAVEGESVELTSFKINNEEVPLPIKQPIQLNIDDTIYYHSTNGIALFLGEPFTIELSGVDQMNNGIIIPLYNSLNEIPSKEWVDEKVKERENK
ncbi:hypothetical protein [Lysinibacillus sp. 54212]|uniref:hypothetical protein n=1 Tax=Lysinibacillus sp. 54212 TaxID=3119829 RepID=UPI002FC6289C